VNLVLDVVYNDSGKPAFLGVLANVSLHTTIGALTLLLKEREKMSPKILEIFLTQLWSTVIWMSDRTNSRCCDKLSNGNQPNDVWPKLCRLYSQT
jgi:hypothetical protein